MAAVGSVEAWLAALRDDRAWRWTLAASITPGTGHPANFSPAEKVQTRALAGSRRRRAGGPAPQGSVIQDHVHRDPLEGHRVRASGGAGVLGEEAEVLVPEPAGADAVALLVVLTMEKEAVAVLE